jgi:hypothetical protein
MACTVEASKGLMTSKRGSGELITASCFTFIIDP